MNSIRLLEFGYDDLYFVWTIHVFQLILNGIPAHVAGIFSSTLTFISW